MKTSSNYKLQTLQRAIRAGQKPEVTLRGDSTRYRVEDVRNKGYAAELRLERRGGTIIVDPDDILFVKVVTMPTAADRDDD